MQEKPMNVGMIVDKVAGEYYGPESAKLLQVANITYQLKNVRPGSVYYASNSIINDASEAWRDRIARLKASGAILLVTPRKIETEVIPLLVVKSMKDFFSIVGLMHRRLFDFPVVACTGSNGKSTVIRMLEHILSLRMKVIARTNWPNQDICPIFDFTDELDAALIETPNGLPGGNDYNGSLVRPDLLIFTNIDWVHADNFKKPVQLADILASKLEILKYLAPTGNIYLNGNDPNYSKIAHKPLQRIRTYGLDPEMDAWASNISFPDDFSTIYTLHIGNEETQLKLPNPGLPIVMASLAAALVAHDFGFSIAEIKKALEIFQAANARLNIIQNSAITIINDAYNASPESMKAAIDVLRNYKKGSRKILIAGWMAELADKSRDLHLAIGDYINSGEKIDVIIIINKYARDVIARITGPQFVNSTILAFENKYDAMDAISQIVKPGDLVLIKASRVHKFETIVKLLQEQTRQCLPAMRAGCWLAYDMDKKEILAERNMFRTFRTASTLKIMTAMLALEKLDLNAELKITADLAKKTGLRENEIFTVKDCLHDLLLNSSNPMASLLAIVIAGDASRFAQMMNAKAQELGMFNTVCVDPHGLSGKNRTSAHDLLKLSLCAFANPVFSEIVKKEFHSIKTNLRSYRCQNTNYLVRAESGHPLASKYAAGGKTGSIWWIRDDIKYYTYALVNKFVYGKRNILTIQGDIEVKTPALGENFPDGEPIRFVDALKLFESIICEQDSTRPAD